MGLKEILKKSVKAVKDFPEDALHVLKRDYYDHEIWQDIGEDISAQNKKNDEILSKQQDQKIFKREQDAYRNGSLLRDNNNIVISRRRKNKQILQGLEEKRKLINEKKQFINK